MLRKEGTPIPHCFECRHVFIPGFSEVESQRKAFLWKCTHGSTLALIQEEPVQPDEIASLKIPKWCPLRESEDENPKYDKDHYS